MSVLSDGEIRDRLASGSIILEDYDDLDIQIQPSSLDLRLGAQYKVFEANKPVDPAEEDQSQYLTEFIPSNGKVVVGPDDFILATTVEWIQLPDDLQAQVKGRSSYGRFGVEIHSTAGLIDPGWAGQITLEISNNTNSTIELTAGERICQLSFMTMDEPAMRPYGTRNDSKYQNQEGATASRANLDP